MLYSPVSWLMAPLALAQGLWVRRRTPRLPEAAGPSEACAGSGPTLRLLAIGDSIVAGVGVAQREQALPARLAAALAAMLEARVCWRAWGANGARTTDLLTWLAGVGTLDAQLLVLSNGLNDVTSFSALKRWLGEMSRLFDRLRALAPEALIVQLGIPPLAHFPALPQPLRHLLGQRALVFDHAGEALVNGLPRSLYLPFRERPDPGLFALDGYHPGPEAVDLWARHLAPAIAAALPSGAGVGPVPASGLRVP
ncbi:MAG: SGNH/GDSL hydrolase family protein [Xanthomonadales bacterium]|nr:SGNH/GDSL hydrolase family protein [Xanthomonadales bacterium]NIN58845.1 SGNH/GDSL hydrolase family protein [Xanthomonadales bacterium]NIN74113.1 SGNH/GDSL hydrolase family protein [Xanthomonadales bacterium]NIO14646.1 SGNH/GDSL hydrolase family protein [Xanthomonadales bacterium]NIP11238.1 SGNH/GDSL hydrolase family protein [Xanthomonadales bacterium]